MLPRFRAWGLGPTCIQLTRAREGFEPRASTLARWHSVIRAHLHGMDRYGTFILMKKTLHIDETLLAEARSASRASSDTETVKLGLEALVRHAAYERLRTLRGTEPGALDVGRRRERTTRRKRSAA